MKAKLNHIAPRRGTKRALALALAVMADFNELYKEFGAVESESNGFSRKLLTIDTKYGPLEIITMEDELEADTQDTQFGTDKYIFTIFSRFSIGGETPLELQRHGVSQYSGKCNHHIYLDAYQVDTALRATRRLLEASQLEVPALAA